MMTLMRLGLMQDLREICQSYSRAVSWRRRYTSAISARRCGGISPSVTFTGDNEHRDPLDQRMRQDPAPTGLRC